MSNGFKRVVATLDNGKSIYAYNMDKDAILPNKLILSGKPEAVENDNGSQYRFSHAESGWFASIGAEDTERMSNVLQLKNADIVIRVNPLKSYDEKDLKGAKPFGGQ